MTIPESTRLAACESLLHQIPKKQIARELGISEGSVRDWSILIQHGNFDWIDHPWKRNRELLEKAVNYWFEHYPIGYSDVARLFGVRPALVFSQIKNKLATLPEMLRPQKIHFWESLPSPSLGRPRMAFEKLSDIPINRPLTKQERKELFEALREAKDQLICAKAIMEVELESTADELKKKELLRSIERIEKELASLDFVN